MLQILFDRLDQAMTLQQAIADPRASQRNTSTTSAEPAFLSSMLRTALEGRGHRFVNGVLEKIATRLRPDEVARARNPA